LHVERSIRIIITHYAYIIFWSLVTDCGFVLRTAFAQQNCEFRQCYHSCSQSSLTLRGWVCQNTTIV